MYLADCSTDGKSPFEDASYLLLPYRLYGNAQDRWARTSDGRPIDTHYDLYQTGYNPFICRHGVKLQAVLGNWHKQVETGAWKVNAQGVAGSIDVFKKADEYNHCMDYRMPIGPETYW